MKIDKSPIPTPGSLVRVRNEVWIATAVIPGRSLNGGGSNLIRLLSVSEDARGETAEVIWETEPGRQVLDAFSLPEPRMDAGEMLVDDPRVLDAFLNAARWGAITNADNDILASPYRAGIDLIDYQFEPLVRALDMSRVSLLVADDVGLGKTIEAGLVIQELELRHRIRSCLIVCPAGLQDKWEKEMRSRFGLRFRILDSAFVTEARRRDIHLNPLKAFPYLIASIDWLKRPERGRILDDAFVGDPNAYPRPFDLLLVDEAHLAAPAGDKYTSVDSDRTRLIRHIAPYFEHRLFVTATPHNGHTTSFWALLELLDPTRFDKNQEPSQGEVEQIMVRRLKADIRLIDPDVPFADRLVHPRPVQYLADEAEAYGRLVIYIDRLEELNRDDRRALTSVRFVRDTLKKRLLSSPAAFATTILRHAETVTEKGHLTNESVIQEAINRAGEDHDTDEAAIEAIDEAVTLTSGVLKYDSRLQADLEWLVEWGANHARDDSGRLTALLELIDEVCGGIRQNWTDSRLVVFTEYRDTQEYLYEQFVAAGVQPERIAEINGSTDLEDRVMISELFNHPPGDDAEVGTTLRILLCTDTASEGIDLHLQCHHLLHYDVPWNPSRMEQRNGRIDRYGQSSPTADIYHFTGVGESPMGRDTRIEEKVASKLSNVVNDLGGANPLFGRLETAHHEALRTGDESEIARYDAEVQTHKAQSTLRVEERRLRRLLENVQERLEKTRSELQVSPDELQHTVNVALALSHQPELQPLGDQPGLYHVPPLSDEWADTLRDLVDPVTGTRRFLTFSAALAKPAPGPLLAHLNHPLVAHATALLRAQVWSTTTQDQLHRVTSRYYDPAKIEGGYDWIGDRAAVAHARVLITGSDGNRLHEGVVARAARLRSGRWAQLDADVHADRLWTSRLPRPAPADESLLEEWDRVAEDLLRNLVARGSRVAEITQSDLQNRLDREVAALEAEVSQAADEMRHTLAHLDGVLESHQASLFDEEVAEQLRFDFERLNQRHSLIRDQVRADIDRVRRRYSEQDVRVFPIAVTFLEPATRP